MDTLLVLSPHLDDAVLSAGQFINAHPAATVATVFAGVPGAEARGAYDASTGLGDGRAAMTRRREEDGAAMAILGATPVHLDFLDLQYRRRSTDEAIAGRLHELLRAHRPATVLGPVGLIHPDHRQLGRVWPTVVRQHPGVTALAYAELPYRVRFAARAAERVRAFAAEHGAVEVPAGSGEGDAAVKARAMLAYASQLAEVRPLDCLAPEHLLRLYATEVTEAG